MSGTSSLNTIGDLYASSSISIKSKPYERRALRILKRDEQDGRFVAATYTYFFSFC